MPMLEKNMMILSTLGTVATLVALLGTVIGMIKAFFALGSGGGTPDAAALSIGISEALINTALGIGTSAIAIILYNFFTSKIDGLHTRLMKSVCLSNNLLLNLTNSKLFLAK